PEERQAFLDKACAGEPSLREQVESLLRASRLAGSFLEAPAAAGMDKPRPKLMAIFEEALDIKSPEERDAYLGAACAGTPGLRRQVDALLKPTKRSAARRPGRPGFHLRWAPAGRPGHNHRLLQAPGTDRRRRYGDG